MRKLLFILFFFHCKLLFAEMSTPASVSTFYSGMKKLSQISDVNSAYYITKSMKDCFFGRDKSVSGVDIPNDFRFFDYDKKSISHEDGNQNSSNYVDKLYAYIYSERVMKVTYNIKKSEAVGNRPEFSRGRLSVSTSLVATFVEKTYELRGFKKTFNDTVYTDYTNGKISEIKNGFGVMIVNINTLRSKAEQAYWRKNYREAYKYYEQIISIKPDDADALYRIGLMTYFQYEYSGVSKRYRKDKAKAYLEKAQKTDYKYGVSEKARNVLFWLKYNV